ncbi:MAG TPA: hypothetical protein VJS92_16655, partial [Candidatus Polarisedimenticolaceae bacterium]|nr:hypothetical protein [Candidatus Polarisedimenticolaceae bacterium]
RGFGKPAETRAAAPPPQPDPRFEQRWRNDWRKLQREQGPVRPTDRERAENYEAAENAYQEQQAHAERRQREKVQPRPTPPGRTRSKGKGKQAPKGR